MLKEIGIVKKINNLKWLQTRAYYGTSGLGIVGENFKSHLHVFSSYNYLEKKSDHYKYSVRFNDQDQTNVVNFSLGKNQTMVLDFEKYISNKNRSIKFVSYRVFHDLPNKDFVPYCFVTSIANNATCSTVHSSSFGTAKIKETVNYRPDFLFDREFMKKCKLIFVTLFPFSKHEKNEYNLNFYSGQDGYNFSHKQSFFGEICCIDLSLVNEKLKLSESEKNKSFSLNVHGPSHANMYLLVNDSTYFHF